ncbi:MAG: T9SS type A sorting domain-containing protein [Candidatus Cloacimonadaceae bacterium]|nr:T9SS type A sorting domain-containing protein [Candidatus Cloacimonadaceae bacterium]
MRIFLVCAMFAVIFGMSLWAQISLPVMIDEIPHCHGFAGESAMQWDGNSLYFTYLNKPGIYTNIVMVKITENAAPIVHIIDNNQPPYIPVPMEISKPTLAISDQQIFIAYKKGHNQVLATSPRDQIEFSLQNSMISADMQPLVSVHNGVPETFLIKNDAFDNGDYQMLTLSSESSNNSVLSFSGFDVIVGKVRSNNDIWIKQGTGNNSGWPIFLDHVYTSGALISIPSVMPYDQIFLGGFTECVPPLTPDPTTMAYTLEQSPIMFPQAQGDDHIIFLTVNGDTYNAMLGTISLETIVNIPVYSSFPPATGDALYYNSFSMRDTLWVSVGSGSMHDNAIFRVNAPLWIRGQFSGNNIIHSPYKIMLSGDITLSGTPAGESPAQNQTDFVTLISGEKIELQYGYRDPVDGFRYHPNCRADTSPTMIYANLVALKTDSVPQREGVFSFEYQHPHPSVPAVYSGGNYYSWIDLSRRRYPQTNASPWPPLIDYPWYNPLWPERMPYLERGWLRHYGSVYQARRGFMHRGYNDVEWPSNGLWNPELDFCGGSSSPGLNNHTDPVLGITLGTVNYPGASGGGIGYKVQRPGDTRGPNWGVRYHPFGFGLQIKRQSAANDWQLDYYKVFGEDVLTKSIDKYLGINLYHLNNRAWINPDSANDGELVLNTEEHWIPKQVKLYNSSYLLQTQRHDSFEQIRVTGLNTATGESPLLGNYDAIADYQNLGRHPGGFPVFANLDSDGSFQFYAFSPTGSMPLYQWQPQLAAFDESNIADQNGTMAFIPAGGDSIIVLLSVKPPDSNVHLLYLAKGSLPGSNVLEELIPALPLKLSAYPNPFKHGITLKIEANKAQSATVNIYNIRGQKVRSLRQNTLGIGENTIRWDGKNDLDQALPAGIYLIQVKNQESVVIRKVLKL